MLIFFPTQHFIWGCFQSSTTDNLHAPIFPACEATRWQCSLAAAQLLLWNSLASPWLRCRTLSPDLSGPGSPQTHVSPLAPCMRDTWCKSLSALVKKKSIWTRYSYWMWYKIFVFNSFFLIKWMEIVMNWSFTFLKCINTWLSSGASLHHCWQISTMKCMKFSSLKSRLHLLRWDPQRGCH